MSIKFVSERKSSFLTTKEYSGYGQRLLVSYDGVETIVSLEPEDPIFGVKITNIENDDPILIFPYSVSLNNLQQIESNIRQAKLFCSDFAKQKKDILKFKSTI